MTKLADLIHTFEADFLQQYGQVLLPSQRRALSAFKSCRNALMRTNKHRRKRHNSWRRICLPAEDFARLSSGALG